MFIDYEEELDEINHIITNNNKYINLLITQLEEIKRKMKDQIKNMFGLYFNYV